MRLEGSLTMTARRGRQTPPPQPALGHREVKPNLAETSRQTSQIDIALTFAKSSGVSTEFG